jgi:uncharacterized protein YjaZ
MGVERTDLWLKESIDDPDHICQKIIGSSDKTEANNLYQYLQTFGMYRPSQKAIQIYKELEKGSCWKKVEKLLVKYKKLWDGPDIPIYIFPLDNKGGLFYQRFSKKSGVSFPDKLFLFLTDLEDEKELEALFVHEYHHICRMQGLKKPIVEYTLLDSIILEGLAEDAVCELVGKEYVANTSKILPHKTFDQYWNNFLKEKLNLKKTESGHDELLFGWGFKPKMLGYTCGFHIVRMFRKEKHFSTKATFKLSSDLFIKKYID